MAFYVCEPRVAESDDPRPEGFARSPRQIHGGNFWLRKRIAKRHENKIAKCGNRG